MPQLRTWASWLDEGDSNMPIAAKSPIRLHQTGHDVYSQREHRRIEKK
jgi:hypothetical protein